MFYKIGFWVLLAIVLLCGVMFVRSNPMKTQGAMSWLEVYSENPTATLGFLKDNFDINVSETSKLPTGDNYYVIKSHGQMWPFAGVMKTPELGAGKKAPAYTMMYLTVKDFDAAHNKIIASGASVLVESMVVEGMRFGIYAIPGGLSMGIIQYGVK